MAKNQTGGHSVTRRQFFGDSFTLAAGASVLLSGLGRAGAASGKSAFSFVHMTDVHLQSDADGGKATTGFLKAIEACNNLHPKPDFVINTGDIVMDASGVEHGRAVELFDLYEQCCKRFEMPVHNVIGNHDMFGTNEGGPGPDAPEYGKQMFLDRLRGGAEVPYYSWDFGRWHFVAMDDIAMTPEKGYEGGVDAAQLQWLAADLKAVGTERPICLALHIPLVTIWEWVAHDPLTPTGAYDVCVNAKNVMKVCEPYNLKLVLQGHQHIHECIRHGGIEFVTGGAVSGSWWSGPFYGDEEGFVHYVVRGDEVKYRYIDYGWHAPGT